jgi:predicted deacetylase
MRNGVILRFDDLCPTVNWNVWNAIEEILIELDVKPIVSVIPDNRDKALFHSRPGENFWDRVQSWQKRGWTIGLHGYQHCYLTKNPGMYGREGLSEFAGLPVEVQEIKLQNAVRIFRQHGVNPEVWVAPAHSFDASTIEILLKLGIRVVNDGYALFPYQDPEGVVWIPQQVGKLRKLPIGIWTVCFHFNSWSNGDIRQLREDLERFRHTLLSVRQVLQQVSTYPHNWVHASAARLLDASLRIGRPLRKGLRERHWYLWARSLHSANANNGKVR